MILVIGGRSKIGAVVIGSMLGKAELVRGLVRSAEPAESLPDAGQRGNFYVNARDARISIVDKGDVGAGTDGYAAQVTSTVEEITGAPARPLERLLEELPTSAGD